MNAALLEVVNLRKHFGAVRAVNGVSLRVHAGEIHAVIGPNGAGKTTLLSALSGEVRADSGDIFFAGRRITKLGFSARARLGLARSFQITCVIAPLTLQQNTALAVQSRSGHSFRFWSPAARDARLQDEAMRYLHAVGLAARADTVAGLASHGERRQLEIAMALALRPKCLLLDEPTAGMGGGDAQAMVALLQRLKHDAAILLIEHDMDAVFSLADKVSVLVNGEIIAADSPRAIRNNSEVQKVYLGEAG